MNDKVNYRTCVCCKSVKYKYDMVRIAFSGGKATCDTDFKSQGRGMYICSMKCIEKISTSKKFAKIYNMISDEKIICEIKGVLGDAN